MKILSSVQPTCMEGPFTGHEKVDKAGTDWEDPHEAVIPLTNHPPFSILPPIHSGARKLDLPCAL